MTFCQGNFHALAPQPHPFPCLLLMVLSRNENFIQIYVDQTEAIVSSQFQVFQSIDYIILIAYLFKFNQTKLNYQFHFIRLMESNIYCGYLFVFIEI